MNHSEHHINIKGEALILSNLRALFWPKVSALIISDVHIGKTAHFRKHGIPVANDVLQKDLERLSYLIAHYNAEKLIVVGDLFHADYNSDFKIFSGWRQEHNNLEIVLIKGNHDRLRSEIYYDLRIKVYHDVFELFPFNFVHEPPKIAKNFHISGHIHPGYLLKVKGQPKLKLPCFQQLKNTLILPAFSLFTGLVISKNQSQYKSYAFSETAFFEFN